MLSESGLTREQIETAANAARTAAEEKRVTGHVMAKVEELAAWLFVLRHAQRKAADARDENLRALGIEVPVDERGLGAFKLYSGIEPIVRQVYDALLSWKDSPKGPHLGPCHTESVRGGPFALLHLPVAVVVALPSGHRDPVVVVDGEAANLDDETRERVSSGFEP